MWVEGNVTRTLPPKRALFGIFGVVSVCEGRKQQLVVCARFPRPWRTSVRWTYPWVSEGKKERESLRVILVGTLVLFVDLCVGLSFVFSMSPVHGG